MDRAYACVFSKKAVLRMILLVFGLGTCGMSYLTVAHLEDGVDVTESARAHSYILR